MFFILKHLGEGLPKMMQCSKVTWLHVLAQDSHKTAMKYERNFYCTPPGKSFTKNILRKGDLIWAQRNSFPVPNLASAFHPLEIWSGHVSRERVGSNVMSMFWNRHSYRSNLKRVKHEFRWARTLNHPRVIHFSFNLGGMHYMGGLSQIFNLIII